jgi:hypothetical protein
MLLNLISIRTSTVPGLFFKSANNWYLTDYKHVQLTHLGSNQDSAEPKSDVLPITPWVNNTIYGAAKLEKFLIPFQTNGILPGANNTGLVWILDHQVLRLPLHFLRLDHEERTLHKRFKYKSKLTHIFITLIIIPDYPCIIGQILHLSDLLDDIINPFCGAGVNIFKSKFNACSVTINMNIPAYPVINRTIEFPGILRN